MAKDVRLQKMLADCGVASRRKAEEMISAGEVKVNGVTAKIGDKVDTKKDKVSVKGTLLDTHVKSIYIMLHKPRGFITTMSDEMDRKCVAELIKEIPERIYPVGRLDRESEGLLLMTNDGEFANAMTHPSLHIPKTYRVTVRPSISEDQLTQIAVGIVIDGRKTAPAKVNVISQEAGRVVLEIVLYEGRNRQIRKMCEQLGLEVARLKRIAVGPVKLGMLQPGAWRPLTTEEIKKLIAGAKADKQNTETGSEPDDIHFGIKRQRENRPNSANHSRRRK
ncbi:pseudouridine synthase [Caproiciproducens faecalis]|uniref:Pseudouridine synthase n=1 Tax=Caproiciproducens faecalis TaxID=2820301 RepID=A0ABS7DSJ4_9FIRM|nr:pseudouridine synthase [Caproiciproducens faecalis]MBW7573992.1 rRNA pseudouridine synthase [Caproiciproducens faecalis]